MTRCRTLLVLSLLLCSTATAIAEGGYPRLLGRVGDGVPTDVVVQGDYAYCAMGNPGGWDDPGQLVVMDISDLGEPVVVGECEFYPYDPVELVVSGSYVYVIGVRLWPPFTSSLFSVDVSDSTVPAIVGQLDFGEPLSQLRVAGDRLHALAHEAGLLIVSAADPAELVQIGTFPMPEFQHDVDPRPKPWDISGQYAYLSYAPGPAAPDQGGIRVVDVSDPASPSEVANWVTPRQEVFSLHMDGTRAYVGRTKGVLSGVELVVLDLSDPDAPVTLGSYDNGLGQIIIAHSGNVLCVANYGSPPPRPTSQPRLVTGPSSEHLGNVSLLDVSDPAAIAEVGTLPISPVDSDDQAIWASDHLAVAAAGLAEEGKHTLLYGLWIFDCSDPGASVRIGDYHTQAVAKDVAVLGQHAFVAADTAGLQMVDVSDPMRPRDAGLIETPSWPELTSAWASYLAFDGYVPDALLWVLDVSDPADPRVVGRVPCDDTSGLVELVVDGHYAYASTSSSYLYSVDLAVPAEPLTVGGVQLGDWTTCWVVAAAAAGRAYAVDPWQSSLRILDVSDPAYISDMGSCPLPAGSYAAAVSGGYVFVPTLAGKLSAVNVTDPHAPFEVAVLDIGDRGYDIAVAGHYAFVTAIFPRPVSEPYAPHGRGTLLMFDISEPSAPREIGRYEQNGVLDELAVIGNCVYVCEDGRGVLVFQAGPFPDVPLSSWAFGEVEACCAAGIVTGYPDGTYQPALAVTRDQMAVYIARALAGGEGNIPEAGRPRSFLDVPVDHWAFDHIEYCVKRGVVSGYGLAFYHPEYEVTRDQMAVYVARAMVAPAGDAGVPDSVLPATFSDVPDTFWAWKHIEYCVEHEVVQGYTDGRYHPDYAVTRDQMAVYIARAFQLPM